MLLSEIHHIRMVNADTIGSMVIRLFVNFIHQPWVTSGEKLFQMGKDVKNLKRFRFSYSECLFTKCK